MGVPVKRGEGGEVVGPALVVVAEGLGGLVHTDEFICGLAGLLLYSY